MKVLVTGATGFVGQGLCLELLRRGHSIHILTRNNNSLSSFPYPCRAFLWRRGESIDSEAFSGVEAVIHLAGAPVIGRRWDTAYKKELWDSRVLGTRHLVEHIQKLGSGINCFVSASAIGYYGDSGERVLTEEDPVASDFLAELCQAWEEEALRLKEKVRTVIPRIGLVLGKGGGLLDRLHPLFMLGLGSPLVNGKFWMSWIHLDDLISFLCDSVEDTSFDGVYNLTAPGSTRNREFMVEMAKRLGTFVSPSVPYLALKLTQGEVAKYLVASQRVYPQRLLDKPFSFKYGELSKALSSLLPSHLYDNEFNSFQWLNRPQEEVFSFFSDEKNLEKITPPWVSLKILNKSTSELEAGTLIDYKLKIHGFPARWRTKIKTWEPPHGFSDIQLKGPYKKWDHSHYFERLAGGTLMRDQIYFRVPMACLGHLFAGSFVKKDVGKIFAYRSRVIEEFFDKAVQ